MNKGEKKVVAILITVYNRKEKTCECLNRIKEQQGLSHISTDIYIIDGGSTDGTTELIKSDYPQVHFKVIEGVYWNRGMWHAWHWASSIRNYDYYLWLNDDTFIKDDCIASLLEASLRKNDQAIIVGASVDSRTQSVITYGGRVGKGLVIPCGEFSEVERFNGNIVLVPDFVFRTLGNLDYYFTHSKGDIDYGKRARKAGIEIWQVGKPLGICDVHPRIDKWCDPDIPFSKRWKLLNMPNGMPPNETFHLDKRHEGWCTAIVHYCTTILHCIFPSIWIALGKTKISQLG